MMEIFCENGKLLEAANCFCKKTPLYMFDYICSNYALLAVSSFIINKIT